jgi:hypothetical protein
LVPVAVPVAVPVDASVDVPVEPCSDEVAVVAGEVDVTESVDGDDGDDVAGDEVVGSVPVVTKLLWNVNCVVALVLPSSPPVA